MTITGPVVGDRKKIRRELLRQYVNLQQALVESDPGASEYQSTLHAFRQVGYLLINSGFEDDLDRLLRLRVLDGGHAVRTPRATRSPSPTLLLMEKRAIH